MTMVKDMTMVMMIDTGEKSTCVEEGEGSYMCVEAYDMIPDGHIIMRPPVTQGIKEDRKEII